MRHERHGRHGRHEGEEEAIFVSEAEAQASADERLPHLQERFRQGAQHELCFEPEHAVAEAPERPFPPRCFE